MRPVLPANREDQVVWQYRDPDTVEDPADPPTCAAKSAVKDEVNNYN
jgi:hypothetical protein